MSELQRRIEYIIEGDEGTDEKAAKIAAMLERMDRHIAKLAEVGMAQEKELAWARGVIGRYEGRMQAMANRIDGYVATAKARAEGREPTFAELATHRHIETERYE